MDAITKRNFISLNEAVKAALARVDSVEAANKEILEQLTQVRNENTALRKQVATLIARFGGGGTTVRG